MLENSVPGYFVRANDLSKPMNSREKRSIRTVNYTEQHGRLEVKMLTFYLLISAKPRGR